MKKNIPKTNTLMFDHVVKRDQGRINDKPIAENALRMKNNPTQKR